jgi:glycosyltransferase involved in cell wall biosynthesis
VEKFPHLHTEQNRFFALSRHRNAAKSNAHFIAVSNQTKKDFIEIYGVDPQRISVVHHGVAIEQIDSVNEDMREKCLRKFGLSNERFVLFVGTLEPRKNLVNLIRAFAGIRNSQTDLKLVIVGMKGWRYEEIFEQIDYCNLREKFLWLGYLDEADKYALMKACEFFVYPSLYEGFGLPVLEAMACSKAIVTSENSAMSEFSKGAAIFVDPKKTDQLGGAMLELLTNEELKKNMSTQAREIAEKMSWKKCALDVLDVYKRTFAELNSEKTP